MNESYLVGVEYPATKSEVVAIVEDRGAPQATIEAIQALPAESFDSADALQQALSRASR